MARYHPLLTALVIHIFFRTAILRKLFHNIFLTWLPTRQVGFQNCGKVYAELEKSRLELQINSNSETASIIPGSVSREWWNPVSSDTKGECHSVHSIRVSVLSGLSGKMPWTRVLTTITQTFLQDNVDE